MYTFDFTIALYTQLFNSYANGCVNHSANDTYFSATLAPIAYNYAASSGNAFLAGAIAKYNLNASSICGSYQVNYASSETMSSSLIASSKDTFTSKSQRFLLLSSCIDTDAMGKAFATSCSLPLNASLYCPINATSLDAYDPPSTYLVNSTCLPSAFPDDLASQVKSSAFNCTFLPRCQVGSHYLTQCVLFTILGGL